MYKEKYLQECVNTIPFIVTKKSGRRRMELVGGGAKCSGSNPNIVEYIILQFYQGSNVSGSIVSIERIFSQKNWIWEGVIRNFGSRLTA